MDRYNLPADTNQSVSTILPVKETEGTDKKTDDPALFDFRQVVPIKYNSTYSKWLRPINNSAAMRYLKNIYSRASKIPDSIYLRLSYEGSLNRNLKGKWGIQRSPLSEAAYNGDHRLAERLINAGANVNWAGYRGVYPIQHALSGQEKAIVRLLIENKADLTMKHPDVSNDAFAFAFNKPDNLEMILFMRSITTERNSSNCDDNKLLSYSLLYCVDIEPFEYFLKLATDIEQRDEKGSTLLMQALLDLEKLTPTHVYRKTAIRKIEKLIDSGADINAADELGETPLLMALVLDIDSIFYRMFNKGRIGNTEAVKFIFNKLHDEQKSLVEFQFQRTAQKQLAEQSDVPLQPNESVEPDHENAISPAKNEQLQFQDNAVEDDNPEQLGKTITNCKLRIEKYKNQIEIMSGFSYDAVLVFQRACKGIRKDGSMSKLISHIEELMEINDWTELFETRELINDQDEKGYTPLHHAVSLGESTVILSLLHMGANPDIKDNEGFTPLQLAETKDGGHKYIAEFLREYPRSACHNQNKYSRVPSLQNLAMQSIEKHPGLLQQVQEQVVKLPKSLATQLLSSEPDPTGKDKYNSQEI